MSQRTFTAGFLFCGLGAGALGFLEAMGRLGREHSATFRSLGGIDLDPHSCADFRMLTGSPAAEADLATMQPAELRAAWGDERPDCIFLSPPCKGFSGLLSGKSAASPKYQALNRLVLQGLFLACETWASPPPLLVLENVPRIQSRGADLLRQVRQLLASYGYVFHEATHDCGEIGGLAQHRRRYLLVARRPADVPSYVYHPPKKQVRGCGEVLGPLPLPEDPAAGPLHKLPRLSWINWLRLALIPAGGDWRDLPKAGAPELSSPLPEGAERRSVWARYDVRPWDQPARTVAGEGSNGGYGVADPRVPYNGHLGVIGWDEPTGVVAGASRPSNGRFAVADPRVAEAVALKCKPWQTSGAYGVMRWDEAVGTVTGSACIDNCRSAVADPRPPGAPKDSYPIIIAADGTWHRPLTTLELAALQGIPTVIDGKPLQLSGKRVAAWRERIGNAVPVGAARAIAESLLTALLAADLGTWTLGGTGIWVERADDRPDEAHLEEEHAA